MNYETEPSFPEFLKGVRFHTPQIKKFSDEIQKRIGGASGKSEKETLEKYEERGVKLAEEHVGLHELKNREDELRKRMEKRERFYQKINCPGACKSDKEYLALKVLFDEIGMNPGLSLFHNHRQLEDSFPLLHKGSHFWQH